MQPRENERKPLMCGTISVNTMWMVRLGIYAWTRNERLRLEFDPERELCTEM